MTQYVGLDVADEETSVCVVDQEGAVLVEAKVASEPAAIAAFHSRAGPAGGEGRLRDGAARGLALARTQAARAPGGVPRCTPRQGGAPLPDQQDRSQRRLWLGPAGAHGLVPR